jgi:hypothetical protein
MSYHVISGLNPVDHPQPAELFQASKAWQQQRSALSTLHRSFICP